MTIDLDEDTAQRFRLFCLMLQSAPPGEWELTKIQSYPNGNVTIHIKIVPNLTTSL